MVVEVMQQQNRLMIIFIDLLGRQIDQMGGYNKCLFSTSTSSARLDCALLGFGLSLLQMSITSAWFSLFWQASERPMTSIVCDKMQIGDIPAAEL